MNQASKIDLPRIVLKPKADRRLRRGHRWLYSNEIDTRHCSLAELPVGQAALVYDAREKLLGSAFFDRRALRYRLCAVDDVRRQSQRRFFDANAMADQQIVV